MDVSLSPLTVAVYSNAIQDNINSLLYPGFIEELVDIIELKMNNIVVSIEELLNNYNIHFWILYALDQLSVESTGIVIRGSCPSGSGTFSLMLFNFALSQV